MKLKDFIFTLLLNFINKLHGLGIEQRINGFYQCKKKKSFQIQKISAKSRKRE